MLGTSIDPEHWSARTENVFHQVLYNGAYEHVYFLGCHERVKLVNQFCAGRFSLNSHLLAAPESQAIFMKGREDFKLN